MKEAQLDLFTVETDSKVPDAETGLFAGETHAQYRKRMGLACPVCRVAPDIACRRGCSSPHPKRLILDPTGDYLAVEERAARQRGRRARERGRRARVATFVKAVVAAASPFFAIADQRDEDA